ncbi:MAG: thioredoxin family protein, partial [Pseudomonadota bacterium]
ETKLSFGKGVRSTIIVIGFVYAGLFSIQSLQKNNILTSALPSIGTSAAHQKAVHPEFTVVKNLEDFEQKLSKATTEGRSVMVDLYADWCIACKEFEAYTFPDPSVVAALGNTEWMQIDLTHNTPENIAFQESFAVLGLPTILFFDAEGNELERARVTGFMNAEKFADHVNKALN